MNETTQELFPKTNKNLLEIIDALRSMVRATLPDAKEFFYHSSLCYGLKGHGFNMLIYIMAHPKHVNLGFFFGKYLDDPKHILQGTGKRMRHVKIKTIDDTKDPALQGLVKTAWLEGLLRITELKGSKN